MLQRTFLSSMILSQMLHLITLLIKMSHTCSFGSCYILSKFIQSNLIFENLMKYNVESYYLKFKVFHYFVINTYYYEIYIVMSFLAFTS